MATVYRSNFKGLTLTTSRLSDWSSVSKYLVASLARRRLVLSARRSLSMQRERKRSWYRFVAYPICRSVCRSAWGAATRSSQMTLERTCISSALLTDRKCQGRQVALFSFSFHRV